MVEESDDPRPTESLPPNGRPAAPPAICLVVTAGPDQGAELMLEKGTYFVGKGRGCDLVLRDAAVSRRHLQLSVDRDGILVRDLASKNGTFYQGMRFSQMTVGSGAVLTIGGTDLRLTSPRSAQSLPPSAAHSFGGLFGWSLPMRQLFAVLERIAGADAPVLVTGETGSGKKLCARALHDGGPRAAGPFVVWDSPDIEAALAQAHGGTLVIDEIAELDLELQSRLVRALDRPRDVRIVATSTRDLAAETKAGRFREELYHRVAFRVAMPPLRERKEDIAPLVARFIDGRKVTVDAQAMALLFEYDWPGNVLELRNTLERALALVGQGVVLEPQHLGLTDAAVTHLPPSGRFREAKERLIGEWERAYVTELLRRARGNVSLAARSGGLDRPYLYQLMKKHGLGGSGP